MPETNQGNPENRVMITRINPEPSLIQRAQNKLSNYSRALVNTYKLVRHYHANQDPNAFHCLLQDQFDKLPEHEVKILEVPVLSPGKNKICQRIISIGNPVILAALRKIPRTETVDADYFNRNPETPRIGGGRAFNSVLEAIGMGILSAEHGLHAPFIQEMISTLTIRSIAEALAQEENSYKSWLAHVVKEETQLLLAHIKQAGESQQPFSPDFRIYALKIFLRGFYPNAFWEESWIQQLSQIIEHLSDLAFKHVVNPYASLEELRAKANFLLDPFLERILHEDQTFFLSKSYVAQTEQETLKQIISSLLFAGGDNIKKYLDHLFVELGNENIRTKYLSQKPSAATLKLLIEETGRLYTTIYAQPGKALEDFTIEYLGKKVFVKAGDELHYTTWIANRDKMEWGESAAEFNPEKHQSHYTRLNPLATFGSGSRVCRGKSLTLAIIEYFTTQVLELTSWTAYVDGKTNYHPTELNFNNGVKGNITYTFQLRNQQVNSEEVRQWNEVSDASPGHNIHSMLSRKQKEKETIRTTPETQMVIAQMRL